jgi:hypothetical protein
VGFDGGAPLSRAPRGGRRRRRCDGDPAGEAGRSAPRGEDGGGLGRAGGRQGR